MTFNGYTFCLLSLSKSYVPILPPTCPPYSTRIELRESHTTYERESGLRWRTDNAIRQKRILSLSYVFLMLGNERETMMPQCWDSNAQTRRLYRTSHFHTQVSEFRRNLWLVTTDCSPGGHTKPWRAIFQIFRLKIRMSGDKPSAKSCKFFRVIPLPL